MIDWKYAARDKLRDYVAQQNAVQNIPQEIEKLKLQAESIKSMDLDSLRVMGGEATREDMLLGNMQHRAELERNLERAKIAVKQVTDALGTLESDEVLLLDMMHIHPSKGKIERIMDEFKLQETKSVYRRVDKALYKFTVAYYGFTES
jgi:hypothetical protein